MNKITRRTQITHSLKLEVGTVTRFQFRHLQSQIICIIYIIMLVLLMIVSNQHPIHIRSPHRVQDLIRCNQLRWRVALVGWVNLKQHPTWHRNVL